MNIRAHIDTRSGSASGSPKMSTGRDTRLDVLRALALITIFVNHVPGQFFEHLTTKNFGFSDGAEAFVLISGISVGLAYGTRFKPGNRLLTAWKAVKRAFTLYTAHMITTFITLVLFISGAWIFRQVGLLCEVNILAVLMNPARGIQALLLLGHQIGYNNILPMYGALFLMLPLMLVVEARSPLFLLLASAGVWLLAGIYQIAPHTTLLDGFWFLNPLSWQFLFVIGFVAVMHVKRGGRIAYNPILFALSLAYVMLSFIWVTDKLWVLGDHLAAFGLPPVITGFDKTFLSLPRLLHVLALAYLIICIPSVSRALRRPADHPLVILGRHSLSIFVAGTILAMAGQVILYVTEKDPAVGAAYVVVGIVLQFAYAYYLEHKRLDTAHHRPVKTSVGALRLPVRIERHR
ncbi:succinyl transferase OpgC [Agrobacterium rhizogenes]|nr:succinyl transferase OpgC [Rhizobium rhizogenes]NTH78937.1 succinyl transferase OpgC [Rhizobium rhizogenes]NTH84945.1 succinyl transferase OpgC [Rhizobium rhizogenes]NTI43345.1 succinyl transferase OpgC [Rhizobium rhizogenes]NTI50373.1 succinyl transferase OpgC [Rhizobium rhizogenes]